MQPKVSDLRAYRREWYAKNKEQRKAYQKLWRADHSEQEKARQKAKYIRDKDKVRTRNAKRYLEKKEIILETNRRIYRRDKEKTLKRCRAWALKKKYGITVEQYDNFVKEQNGICANLHCTNNGTEDKQKKLVVDHCHTTGKTRGLLCRTCNFSLGLLGESTTRIRGLADYIERTGQ